MHFKSVSKSSIAVLLAFVIVLAATGTTVGSGTESSGLGARGRAMGYAMVAIADDWTAIHYNPAGITQTKGKVFGIEYGLFSGGMYSSESLRNLAEGGNPARSDFIDPIGDEPRTFGKDSIVATINNVSFGYVSAREDIAFGIGLYGSGSGTGWDDSITTAGGDTIEAEIHFLNASINMPLVMAYRVSPRVSVGMRVAVHYGLLDVDNNKYRTGAIPYTMAFSQDTEGIGVSADSGVLWQVTDAVSAGLVLKLPYSYKREGETVVDQSLLPLTAKRDTTIKTSQPTRIAAGIGVRPDDKSVIALNATWMDWSEYNLKTSYDGEIPGVLVNSSGNPSDWEDVIVVSVGYERHINPQWALRCGLMYDPAPEPESARTLVGGLVVDAWKMSVGGGRTMHDSRIDFGYTYTYGPEVDGYIPGADYSTTQHELYLGYEF